MTDQTSDVPYKRVYFAGSNMPGYMPDSPAHPFATYQEARDSVIEDLLRYAVDGEDDHDNAEAYKLVEQIKGYDGDEFNARYVDYVFWVSKDALSVEDLDGYDGVESGEFQNYSTPFCLDVGEKAS